LLTGRGGGEIDLPFHFFSESLFHFQDNREQTTLTINPSQLFYFIEDVVFACRIMYSQKVM